MELFLPSLLLIICAVAIIMVFPQFTPLLLALIAFIALVLAVYNHYSTFSNSYRVMSWLDSATQFVPYLMTGLVIALLIGYLLYIFGLGKAGTLQMPSANIPPPATATNYVTRAIGNGLVAAGANVSPIANTAHANVANSVLSKGV